MFNPNSPITQFPRIGEATYLKNTLTRWEMPGDSRLYYELSQSATSDGWILAGYGRGPGAREGLHGIYGGPEDALRDWLTAHGYRSSGRTYR